MSLQAREAAAEAAGSSEVHAVIKVFESVKATIVLEWPFLFVSRLVLRLLESRRLELAPTASQPQPGLQLQPQKKRRNLDVKQFGLLQMVLTRLLSTIKVQKLTQNHRT